MLCFEFSSLNDYKMMQKDFSFPFFSVSSTQRMVALFVSSHYKNSPNDLQLMADAPAHHLFVLLGILFSFATRMSVSHKLWQQFICNLHAGPVDESNNILPDILCVIQVSIFKCSSLLLLVEFTSDIWILVNFQFLWYWISHLLLFFPFFFFEKIKLSSINCLDYFIISVSTW